MQINSPGFHGSNQKLNSILADKFYFDRCAINFQYGANAVTVGMHLSHAFHWVVEERTQAISGYCVAQ